MPSVEETEQRCEPDKKGACRVHECAMRKIKISTKKWKDRGKGRGFGFVSVRVTKYACDAKRLDRGPEYLTRLRDYDMSVT